VRAAQGQSVLGAGSYCRFTARSRSQSGASARACVHHLFAYFMDVSLNPQAVTYATRLIQEGTTTDELGNWAQHNPEPAEENAFLADHEIGEFGNWHLGLDMSKGAHTKSRYKFPCGDFKTIRRDGLVAAQKRAAQQGYVDIEQAAEKLLLLLTQQH
jgi:hypothetical protein